MKKLFDNVEKIIKENVDARNFTQEITIVEYCPRREYSREQHQITFEVVRDLAKERAPNENYTKGYTLKDEGTFDLLKQNHIKKPEIKCFIDEQEVKPKSVKFMPELCSTELTAEFVAPTKEQIEKQEKLLKKILKELKKLNDEKTEH